MLYGLKLNSKNQIIDTYTDEEQQFVNAEELGYTIYDIETDVEPQAYQHTLVERDGKYFIEENTETPQEYLDILERERKIVEIQNLKQYLAQTDFVVIKMQEAFIFDNNDLLEELKVKYADVLVARQQARARINELEILL